MELEQRVYELESSLSNIKSMLSEAVLAGRNPVSMWNKLQGVESMLTEYAANQERILKQLKEITASSRFYESFTDAELQGWYDKSEMGLKELQVIITAAYPDKEEISLQMVSNYINGKVQDLKIRSFIGKVLRDAANRKNAKKAEPA